MPGFAPTAPKSEPPVWENWSPALVRKQLEISQRKTMLYLKKNEELQRRLVRLSDESHVAKLEAKLEAERHEKRGLEEELRALQNTNRAQGAELLKREVEGDRHAGPALLAAKHGELQVRRAIRARSARGAKNGREREAEPPSPTPASGHDAEGETARDRL